MTIQNEYVAVQKITLSEENFLCLFFSFDTPLKGLLVQFFRGTTIATVLLRLHLFFSSKPTKYCHRSTMIYVPIPPQ